MRLTHGCVGLLAGLMLVAVPACSKKDKDDKKGDKGTKAGKGADVTSKDLQAIYDKTADCKMLDPCCEASTKDMVKKYCKPKGKTYRERMPGMTVEAKYVVPWCTKELKMLRETRKVNAEPPAPACGDKAGDDKAGDDKAGDDKAGGDKAGGDKAGGDKAGGDKAAAVKLDKLPANAPKTCKKLMACCQGLIKAKPAMAGACKATMGAVNAMISTKKLADAKKQCATTLSGFANMPGAIAACK